MGKDAGDAATLERRVRRDAGRLVDIDSPRNTRRPSWPAAVLVVILGLALGVLTYRIAAENERKRVELQFRERVAVEASGLEKKVVALEEILYSSRGQFDASGDVNTDEFGTFVEGPLLRHAAIHAVAWVPAVRESQKQRHEEEARGAGLTSYRIDGEGGEFSGGTERVYFPVLHVLPHEPGDLPVGRDLASSEVCLRTIERAAKTRSPTLSDPAPSIVDGELHCLMMLAVYGDLDSLDTGAPRLRGFVVLLFRPGELLTSDVRRFAPDMTAQLSHPVEDGDAPVFMRSLDFTEVDCCDVEVRAADQTWRLSAVPSAAFRSRWATVTPQVLGVIAAILCIGLVGGVLLSGWVIRQRDLRGQDRIVRSVLASLEEGVVVADRTGHVVFANDAAERVLGVQPHSAGPGRLAATWKCYQSADLELCPESGMPLVRALRGEVVRPMPMFVRDTDRADGGRWVSMSATPLRNANDEVTGAVSVLRDVTSLRASEAQRIEMRLASAVQRKLYPRAAPRLEHFDLAGAVFSADATCGDYFDFISIDDDVLAIAIGDVSGHGLGPALVMTQVRSYLRAFAQTMTNPAGILSRMNRVLISDLQEGYFVTLLVAFLDLRTREIQYVNAGHVPAQILDEQGEVRGTLDRTGLPLGIVADGGYAACRVQLEPGDTVVFMTDGLIESRTPDGEFLWDEGAVAIVAEHLKESASDIVETIYERVRQRSEGMPLADDLAMVVLKSHPPAGDKSLPLMRERAPSPRGTISRRAR